ncbi:tRNA (cytosine(38)-C(5))-methyltransferase-like isoform X1 [Artemia franciscana]|uniref:tRNA (cytosine(38)-C(5))-methyltransferase-like isoform X1 n=1 Tax=Artemia franciscana TaxID=6661 RepID=UPI0032DB2448
METIKVLELFAGLGGFHIAVNNQRDANIQVIKSFEINVNAVKTYQENFGYDVISNRNILSLSTEELIRQNVNAIFMSPPCQPFTRLGKKLDVNDDRCNAFHHVLKLLPRTPNIQYLLIENVYGFESSKMRENMLEILQSSGFYTIEFLLSPTDFGVPNSRLRYYLLARKNKKFTFCKHDPPSILKEFTYCTCGGISLHDQSSICSNCQREVNTKISSLVQQNTGNMKQSFLVNTSKLHSYLDEKTDIEQYAVPDKILLRYGNILDLRTFQDSSSCCFTKGYTHLVEGSGSVLVCNRSVTIEEAYKAYNEFKETNSEAALNSLRKLKIRYFTPKEVERLMCFPDNYIWPKDLSDKTKYKLLGNSVNVHVVTLLVALLIHS